MTRAFARQGCYRDRQPHDHAAAGRHAHGTGLVHAAAAGYLRAGVAVEPFFMKLQSGQGGPSHNTAKK